MAGRIRKEDIIDPNVIGSIVADFSVLRKHIADFSKDIEGDFKSISISASKMVHGASDSKALRDVQAQLNEINKLVESKKKLNAVEKDLEKAETDAIKTNNALRKAKMQKLTLDEKEAQLQRKLTSEYHKQSKELNDLRHKYKDLAVQNKSNTKEAKDLLKQITALDTKLKQVDATVGQHQRNVGNYRDSLRGLAGSILAITGVTVGLSSIGSFIGDSSAAFKEFDSQLKETSAITGIAGKDLDDLKQKALEVGSNSRVGASEYLESIKIIASAQPKLLGNAEGLDKVAKAAITLNEATGGELSTTTANLTDAMNQFGASANEAGKFIDVLAAGSKFGAAEVPEITEALLKMGLVAKSSNISIQESTALIEALAERGLKGAEAGTQLRNVLLKLSTAKALPRNAVAELKAAGVDMEVLADKSLSLNDRLAELSKIAKNDTAIVKVFGTENVVAAKAILNNRDRIAELTEAVDENGVAMEQANVNNQSAAAQSEILNNKLEAVQIQIGEKLTPAMNGLKSALIDVLEGFSSFIDAGTELAQKSADINFAILGMYEYTSQNIQAQKDLAEGIEITSEKSKKLARDLIKQSETTSDYISVTKELKKRYDVLDKSTGKTRELYDQLNVSIENGTIGLKEYVFGIKELTDAQNTLEDVAAGAFVITKSQNEEMAEMSEKERKANEQAAHDEFARQLKLLEEKRIVQEIGAEQDAENEKDLANRKLKITLEYLKAKEELEIKFGEDYIADTLAIVQTENKIRKDGDDLRKAEAEELNQLRIAAIKDEEKKAIELVKDRLKKELEALEKQGILTTEIRKKHQKLAQEEIDKIHAEHNKKRLDADIDKIDQAYDEQELALLRSGESEDKIAEKIHKNDIARLENKIFRMQEAGEDTTKMELELEKMKRQSAKETADQIDEIRRDMTSKALELAEQEIQRESELRQRRLDDEISARERRISVQQELAEKGLKNNLAFEEAELAKSQLRKEQEAKREQRRLEGIAFLKLLSGYAEEGPASQALQKAFRDFALSKIIQGAFADGVEDLKGPGTEKSDSIPVLLSRGESVVTAEATRDNRGMATAANKGQLDNWIMENKAHLLNHKSFRIDQAKANASYKADRGYSDKYLRKMVDKMDSLEKTVKNKREYHASVNDLKQIVETIVDGKIAKHLTHSSGGPNL